MNLNGMYLGRLIKELGVSFIDKPTNQIVSAEENAPIHQCFRCRMCGLEFASNADQQIHFKSVMHVNNLKRTLNGLQPIDSSLNSGNDGEEVETDTSDDSESEEQEAPLPCSVSFLSGECSFGSIAKEYESTRGTSYIFMPTQYPGCQVRVHSNLLPILQSLPDGVSPCEEAWRRLSAVEQYGWKQFPRLAVLLLQSGRFAGAIFDSPTMPPSEVEIASMLQGNGSGGSGKAVVLQPVVHRVVRRYTVRAKAGGSQSSHDNKGRAAKSMGAQLRRYGEQQLRQEIQELLRQWCDEFTHCSLILVSVSKTLQSVLFLDAPTPVDAEDKRLSRSDPRVRRVGCIVQKPTYEECMRLATACVTVNIEPKAEPVSVCEALPVVVEAVADAAPPVPAIAIPLSALSLSSSLPMGPAVVAEAEVAEESPVLFRVLLHLCRSNNAAPLRFLLSRMMAVDPSIHPAIRNAYVAWCPADPAGPPSAVVEQLVTTFVQVTENPLYFDGFPQPIEGIDHVIHQHIVEGHDTMALLNEAVDADSFHTLLHVATKLSLHDVLRELLYTGIANPAKKDVYERSPYYYCSDKECREVYRWARGHFEEREETLRALQWTWDKCGGVPAGLTAAVEEEQRLREAEKRRKARQRKKEKSAKEETTPDLVTTAPETPPSPPRPTPPRTGTAPQQLCCEVCGQGVVPHLMVVALDKFFCSQACAIAMRRQLMAAAAERRMGITPKTSAKT